jgi:hypothetical protein
MTSRTTQVISLFVYVWGGVSEKEETCAFLGVVVVRKTCERKQSVADGDL